MIRFLVALGAACVAIAAVALPSVAHAATFEVGPQDAPCQLRLTGRIDSGDLERLKAKLPADFDPGMKGETTICLNSPGGNFVEGLRIAQYVSNGLSTRLEKGAQCVSACGWIFLAGTSAATKGVRDWHRTMDAHAQLAFHAPFVDPADVAPGSFDRVELVRAYNQAVAEIADGLLKLAQKYDSPPRSPLVPPTLLAESMVKTGDDLLKVETTGMAVQWRLEIDGYGGIVPRSRQDIARACLLASWQANAWPLDFLKTVSAEFLANLTASQPEDYVAYYDAAAHKLTAQVVLDGRGSIACELEFQFNDQLNGLEGRQIVGTANLDSSRSLAREPVWGDRTPAPVTLPDFSILPQDTRLANLPAREGRPVDLKPLVTIGPPDWCRTQQVKKPEEKTVCDSAKLSALDTVLNRFYREALAGDSKAEAQANQRSWLSKRQLCGDDADCLEQTYRAQITKMYGNLPRK